MSKGIEFVTFDGAERNIGKLQFIGGNVVATVFRPDGGGSYILGAFDTAEAAESRIRERYRELWSEVEK